MEVTDPDIVGKLSEFDSKPLVQTILSYLEEQALYKPDKHPKSYHEKIAKNLDFHMQEDSFPILQAGPALLYFLLTNQGDPKVIVSFYFRHMPNIPLIDIANSLKLLPELDHRRQAKYI